MTIDKSWIHIQNRLEPAFRTGLEAFIERCKNYLNDQGRCHCPCRKCGNRRYQTPQMIDGHIERFGFEPSYKIWTHHGEVRPPRVVPATTTGVEDFLHDIAVDTNDDPDDDDVTEIPSATKDDTDNLFDYAKTELYPGCTWENSLDFLAKMLNMKVLFKWTDHSFDKLLEYLKFCMPKDNTVPSSHYEAKKVMKKIGLGYESIHACKNDCCLFWKENKKLEVCPICGESRWKDTNTTGKKVANKILRYFPLTPRLKRLYRSRHTAKYMTWHATGQCSEPGKMRHPVDGSSWKDFDRRYPEFAGEARNVRLGLSADGFNPYGNMSLSYSMWPVIVTTYNMPPWLCMKQTSLMLTLLIPGPKSPGKDIDVYLRPLVDELKTLWSEGVRTLDVVTDTYFTMKAMLLWTINDFPARSSLSGWSGQGYKACPTCNEDTPSTRVIGKTAFVGHRRFLETNHHWRSNKSFNNKNDQTKPPRQFNHEVVSRQLAKLPTSIPGKHPSNAGVKRKRGEHNWTKISIFRELEYWKFISLQHNLDVMHIEKNVCESLLGTLLMNDKSKDTHNARVDLKNLGIRKELWLIQRDARYLKPHPKYSFTNENRQKFCRFIKEVKLPDGFGSSFKRKVTDNYNNIMGMKSHDCHIMMQRLLPVGVRGCLDDNISRPIIELCAFFKQICARELMVDDMLNAQDQLIKLLCNLELIFPPAFFDIMVHLVMHLPQEAIQGGPVYMRWMYPFEREMKKLKNYVRNKARPEGCIAEGYVADEALTICSLYLKDVETRFNRPDRNEDVPIIPCSIHVFQSHCRPISKGLNTTLTQELRMNLHWYVLNNCSDIDVYKK